jgi:tRNA threonylcarbamoyladenosine biosynthesis protein TsaB
MRLLLINTCGLEGVLALAEDASVVAVEKLPGRGASEAFLPGLRRLMDGKGWTVGGLAAVVVVNGPGSFTGVRVGLSAAKGLCEAGGVRMVALSRLALVAAEVQGADGEVVALLDAGRGELYCGVYAAAGGRGGA